MKRYYEMILNQHFKTNRQMFFIAGPRQVGKTFLSLSIEDSTPPFYLNWDNLDHRQYFLDGPQAVAEFAGYPALLKKTLILDEIHKFKEWKIWLKGFFDTYQQDFNIIVTGSAKLDVYQQGGDSLMGRYFLYRLFPLSLAEINTPDRRADYPIRSPMKVEEALLSRLYEYGGFPEPYIKADKAFSRKWQESRMKQLLTEDIRAVSDIRAISELEMMAKILQSQVGSVLNRSAVAKKIRVSSPTVDKWISLFESVYLLYLIKPWHKNVTRSLIKEPKLYLWDWSIVTDPGARFENLLATHLFKAIASWNDEGHGSFDLYYIRDKEQREVDFLVTRDEKPWFLVEAKTSSKTGMTKYLKHFHEQLGTHHAFQVTYDGAFVPVDCFSKSTPVIVPALTFLSQLV